MFDLRESVREAKRDVKVPEDWLAVIGLLNRLRKMQPNEPQVRGYFIKNDYYNGINFAFLLNERASVLVGDEAIADRVFARRVRAEVLTLCDAVLSNPSTKPDDRFWASASKVEALAGMGRTAEADALKAMLTSGQVPGNDSTTPERPVPAQWMIDSMNEQLAKLAALNP